MGTMSMTTGVISSSADVSSAVPTAESLSNDPSSVSESGAPTGELSTTLVVETPTPDSSTLLTASSATATATTTQESAAADAKATETKVESPPIESKAPVEQPVATGEAEKQPNADLTGSYSHFLCDFAF